MINKFFAMIRPYVTIFDDIERIVPKSGLIVDLGCGYGLFAKMLAERSEKRTVYGIDISPQKIAVAKRKIEGRKNLQFRAGDLKEIDIPACDVIVCYDVLHHLSFDSQIDLLKQCYHKLNNGGLLVIKDNDMSPRWKYYINYIHERLTAFFNITAGDELSFRRSEEFRDILVKIGFNVKVKQLKTYLPYPFVLILGFKKKDY